MVLSLSFITYRNNRGMLRTYHFFFNLQARFSNFLIFFEKLRFFNKLFLQKFFIVLFLFYFNFLESLFIIEQKQNESRKDSRIESAFYRFYLAAIRSGIFFLRLSVESAKIRFLIVIQKL